MSEEEAERVIPGLKVWLFPEVERDLGERSQGGYFVTAVRLSPERGSGIMKRPGRS